MVIENTNVHKLYFKNPCDLKKGPKEYKVFGEIVYFSKLRPKAFLKLLKRSISYLHFSIRILSALPAHNRSLYIELKYDNKALYPYNQSMVQFYYINAWYTFDIHYSLSMECS